MRTRNLTHTLTAGDFTPLEYNYSPITNSHIRRISVGTGNLHRSTRSLQTDSVNLKAVTSCIVRLSMRKFNLLVSGQSFGFQSKALI